MSSLRCYKVLGLLSLTGILSLGAEEKQTPGPAVTPQPRVEAWWFTRHAEKIGAMKDGEYELLMVGDSITHNFESIGEKVWKKHFEPSQPNIIKNREGLPIPQKPSVSVSRQSKPTDSI